MRIQEKIEASATCAKMTEERTVNGVCEGPAVAASKRPRGYVLDGVKPQPVDLESSHAVAGGRLRFFKDGKSILELSYQRDGDGMRWVSNWPVPGAGTNRQESTTASLSVSDDNSSIQSSPWQRDHSWKQASPRRGRGAHLQFLMRPLNVARRIRRLSFLSRSIRRKRRRPYDSAEMNAPLIKEEDADESLNSSMNSSLNSSRSSSKGKLPGIVQNLMDRVKTNEPARPIISGGRVDPNIISPRKRMLREFEKVTLEEGSNSKRQKSRISQGNGATSSNNSSTVTCHTLHPAGVPPPVKTAASSYSITSLLAPREEEPAVSKETEPSFLRNLLKSPSSQAGSDISDTNNKIRSSSKSASVRKMVSPQQQPVTSPTLSPSPGLRSPAIPTAIGGAAHYGPYMHGPLVYPQFIPHHPVTAPYFPGFAAPHSPGPPLWIPYMSMSSLPRASLYSNFAPTYHSPLGPSPWAPLNHHHQPTLDDLRKEDDMPLNLSKHAG